MKKNLVLIALIGFVMTILFGCGGSSSKESSEGSSITGLDGIVYESYREACRAGDFEAAHKFLDRMKEENEYWTKVEEAEDYIFNYEVNALVAQNSVEANNRVIYLLNEIPINGIKCPTGTDLRVNAHSGYGNSCGRFNIKLNKIMEIAISLDNQDIAKKILPLYKEDEIVKGDWRKIISAYTYDSKEAAQRKYNEAFGEKEGVEEEDVKRTPQKTKKKRR